MRLLSLAWRHFLYYRKRGVLLVASIVLVFLLPVSLARWVDDVAAGLAARAEATPLVLGARGSRYDLVLSALYFRGRIPAPLSMQTVEELQEGELADPIPLVLGHSASGRPIVGTTHDYYGFRGLAFAAGGAPAYLGEAALGARVARELGLGPGDTLLTDQTGLHELSLTNPLRLHVSGVLTESGTPDDEVVLCDVKTAWILDGLVHGHVAAEEERPERVLSAEGEVITLGPATYEHTEITADNLASFHLHAEPETLPVQAVLCVPRDAKGATILKGRLRVSSTAQALVPSEVVGELLGLVFRLQRFFAANTLVVAIAMGMLFVLVFLLSLRLRAAEFETLARIGFARRTVASLVACEWLLILALGALGVLLASALVHPLFTLLVPRILTGGGA